MTYNLSIPYYHTEELVSALSVLTVPFVSAEQMLSELERSGMTTRDFLADYDFVVTEQLTVHGHTAYLIETKREEPSEWFIIGGGWLQYPDGCNELEFLFEFLTYE